MKDLKEFYENWSKSSEGDQSKWLSPNSSHYERFMSYLKMSSPHINKESRVLDIGCGEGNLLSILPKCKKYGVDIASRYVEISKKKNPGAVIKIYDADKKLPFDDNYFDFIFCTEVIEHVNNPDNLLREIKRVLKHDGKALISTYNHWNLVNILTLKAFTKKYVSDDHLREYNYITLKKFLIKKNFSVIKIMTVHFERHINRSIISKIFDVLKFNKFINILFKKT